MSRTDERDHIFTSLGLLIAPISRLVHSGRDMTKEVPFVEGEFTSSLQQFMQELDRYSVVNSVHFQRERKAVYRSLQSFSSVFDDLRKSADVDYRERHTEFGVARFNEILRKCQNLIRQIPCDFDPLAIDRGSPFQGYLAIRALCAGAGSQLEIFDPYLGPDVFHRYLSQANPAVSVTLVTDENRMRGKAGQEIVSVSQLFAAERPTTYRLLVDSSLHDRHIRCDGKIFHVGGTFKDVGSKDPCSITPADSHSIAATLDGHIGAATEWFGPNQPVHKT